MNLRTRAAILSGLMTGWTTTAIALPTFVEMAESAGISGIYCSWGAAWGDYNNDGYLDLYASTHTQKIVESFFGIEQKSLFFHNNGDFTFTDISELVGIETDNIDPHSVAFIDFDNDGDQDLFVHHGTLKDRGQCENEFYQNNNDGTFTNISTEAGTQGINVRGRGSAWADFDRDGDLDFFGPGEWGEEKAGDGSLLYQNNGDGTFTDIADSAGVRRPLQSSFAAGWIDFNGDDWPDLYVTGPDEANPINIYKNNKNETFTDITGDILGSTLSAEGIWFLAPGDFNNDGLIDFAITLDNSIAIYQNRGGGRYRDVTTRTIGANNNLFHSGLDWGDIDNDGDLDLFAASKNNLEFANILYINNGNGTFTDHAQNTGTASVGAGAAVDMMFIDVDNDGALDIFYTNGAFGCNDGSNGGQITMGPYVLFRNNGEDNNNWIKLDLDGGTSNRNGFGAKILITNQARTQYREYYGIHGTSQNDMPVHFGMGGLTVIENIQISWPSGKVTTLNNVATNQTLVISEPI